MFRLTPESWQAVNPYLDQALGLQEQERAAWLASLREQNPALAADLQMLLEDKPKLSKTRFTMSKT
jgi:hypothetical protein